MKAADMVIEIDALKALVKELTESVIRLEGRSSNFAARVTTYNKVMRAEITQLRSNVEALKPKPVITDRVSKADWGLGHALLKAEQPGKSFFNPSEVRGRVLKFQADAAKAPAMVPAADPVQAAAKAVEEDLPF